MSEPVLLIITPGPWSQPRDLPNLLDSLQLDQLGRTWFVFTASDTTDALIQACQYQAGVHKYQGIVTDSYHTYRRVIPKLGMRTFAREMEVLAVGYTPEGRYGPPDLTRLDALLPADVAVRPQDVTIRDEP